MESKSRLLETLPNFLLFFLFTGCMLLVLLSGAKIYKNVSVVMEEQFSVHTCVSYVTAKVRHYDLSDSVSVGQIGNTEALLLQEVINDDKYLTYLYCYEGNLMELFCSADMEMMPEDGQVIMPLDDMNFSMEKGLLSFSCEVDGVSADTAVYLQSGEGAAQ